MSRSEHLLLPSPLYEAMLQHAHTELPNECCGLLAGVREGEVLRVLAIHPLINEAASPIEYRSEPRSMFEAVREMRKCDHEILAIYHSHPTSEPIPSACVDKNWIANPSQYLRIAPPISIGAGQLTRPALLLHSG